MLNGIIPGPASIIRIAVFVDEALSPTVFACKYIGSVVNKVKSCGYGCFIRYTCVSILLYADDILQLASSVL